MTRSSKSLLLTVKLTTQMRI